MKIKIKIIKGYFQLSLFFICILFSCDKIKEDSLEISLINNSVNCIENLDFNKLHQGNINYDYLYDGLSTNIIRYKIFNNSERKYFIVFDKNSFENFEELNIENNSLSHKSSINKINFNMYSNYKVRGDNSDESSWNEFLKTKNFYIFLQYKDSLNFIKNNKCYNINDFWISNKMSYIENNHFVIHPKETKFFTTNINLPLRDYRFCLLPWNTIIVRNKKYQAGLTLYNNAEETKKYLTPDLKKEIKENGYTIFNGIIQSNKVPVKMVKMPKN